MLEASISAEAEIYEAEMGGINSAIEPDTIIPFLIKNSFAMVYFSVFTVQQVDTVVSGIHIKIL